MPLQQSCQLSIIGKVLTLVGINMVNQFQIIEVSVPSGTAIYMIMRATSPLSSDGAPKCCRSGNSLWHQNIGWGESSVTAVPPLSVFVALEEFTVASQGRRWCKSVPAGLCPKTSCLPGVFLVPVGGIASIGIGIDAPAGVELDHIVGIVGILVSVLELICCRCIGILGGVSGAQKVVQQSFDRGAVAVYVCVVTTARRRGGGYRRGCLWRWS